MASALLLATLFAARAARASWLVPPAPDRPKDFCVVKRDGLYHVFYIRNNPNALPSETQVDFGHATSADLYFWHHEPPILPVRPGLFDRSHVWAPSIVFRDGVYYLFYTGVSDSTGYESSAQRIGIATSTDLYQWNPVDLPVFTCGQVPWAVCDSMGSTPFRDPFVMADPTSPGRWLMYYSTAPASDPAGMIVGVASSNGDFSTWQDLGALWITQRAWSFNDGVESPHLFFHDGLWWLFFTSNSGQPISYATATSPLASLYSWSYRGRLATMLNVNTAGWFASEYLRDGTVDYFCFVNGDRVEFARMAWQASDRFALYQPDLFHVQHLTWEQNSIRVGQAATLDIESKWWSGRTVDLECFWVDSADVWHPVPNAMLGIADHIPVNADLQTYPWTPLALPDSLGAPDSVRIVVRLLDQTAVAGPIWLVRVSDGTPRIDPGPLPPPEGGGGGGGDESDPNPQPILRPLRGGVSSAMADLLVDLPEARTGRLDVFDLQGRRVRTLAERRLPAGATVIGWDGRDDAGRRLGRGLYFVRLTTPQGVGRARLFLR